MRMHVVGPPLDGVAVRAIIGGHLANRPENMERWIRDPQHVAPGTAMPDLKAGEADARDITAFLCTRAKLAASLRTVCGKPLGAPRAHQPRAAALAPAAPLTLDATRARPRSAVADNRTDDPANQCPAPRGSKAERVEYAQVVGVIILAKPT
jgi:hypothetical protein